MNHKKYLMTGIAIFFVLLVGGAGITYTFLTHQPTIETKLPTKIQHLSKSKSSLEKVPAPVHTQATTKDFSKHSPQQIEKAAKESESSLVHASTISTAKLTKTNFTNQAFVAQKEKEEKLTLADLQFGLSQTGLKAQTKATLDTYAKKLRDPQWSVLIQGHTDETGSIRKNLHVGLRRANTVKQYLIKKGISKDRLHAISLGEYQPICMEATPACQLKNRRVSFGMARREDMKTQHAIPVTQEKIALAEWDQDARPSELVNIPEIYKSTIDTPAKVSLIYPAVVHSTPPPSMPSGADN